MVADTVSTARVLLSYLLTSPVPVRLPPNRDAKQLILALLVPQIPLHVPLQPRHVLPRVPQPLQHPRYQMPVEAILVADNVLGDLRGARNRLLRPLPKGHLVFPPLHVDEAGFLHVFGVVAPCVYIEPLALAAGDHGPHPLPVLARFRGTAVGEEDVFDVVAQFEPAARLEGLEDLGDVAGPVGHAAFEHAAVDEVGGGGSEAGVRAGEFEEVAADERDVGGLGVGGLRGGDAGQVDAVDVGGEGELGAAEVAGDDAGAAADVEDGVRVRDGGVDDAVVDEGDEGEVLVVEAGVLGWTGGGKGQRGGIIDGGVEAEWERAA